LKEGGYDGTTRFKVDMQSSDWQSLVNRLLTKKGPVSEGGWSAFLDLLVTGRPIR